MSCVEAEDSEEVPACIQRLAKAKIEYDAARANKMDAVRRFDKAEIIYFQAQDAVDLWVKSKTAALASILE